MNNTNSTFTTPPPVAIVKTWLLLSKEKSEDFEYARKRAINILELLFGSLDNAELYVTENEKSEHSVSIA